MKCLNVLISTFAISCILAAPTNDRPFNTNVRSLLRALTGENNQQQPTSQQTAATQQPAETKQPETAAKDAAPKSQDKADKIENLTEDERNQLIKFSEALFKDLFEYIKKSDDDEDEDEDEDEIEYSHDSHKPSRYNAKGRFDHSGDRGHYTEDRYPIDHRFSLREPKFDDKFDDRFDDRFDDKFDDTFENEDDEYDIDIDLDEAVPAVGGGWVSKNPPHQHEPSYNVEDDIDLDEAVPAAGGGWVSKNPPHHYETKEKLSKEDIYNPDEESQEDDDELDYYPEEEEEEFSPAAPIHHPTKSHHRSFSKGWGDKVWI